MAFALSSPAFAAGQPIPAKFTADGANVSPMLEWTPPPDGTRSLLLIVDDPDAPAGTWVHWVLAGIPPDHGNLPEQVGSPPPGAPHRYFFKLYALDTAPAWKPGVTKDEAENMIQGHVLGEAELMGTYQRK